MMTALTFFGAFAGALLFIDTQVLLALVVPQSGEQEMKAPTRARPQTLRGGPIQR